MTDTRAAEDGMIAAIERSGYYPGLIADEAGAEMARGHSYVSRSA